MRQLTVLALRIVIVTVLAGSLFIQAVIVAVAAVGLDEGGDAATRWPIALLAVLGVLTLEVVAVCVWRLLTMMNRGTLFSRDAFRYVDVVIGAVGSACLLLLGLGVALAPGEDVPPGMVLLIGGVAIVVAGIALIVLVLRMVLAQAMDRDAEAGRLEAEMAAVI